ncbi:MAG: thiamine-phosphate synthase [Phycisphaerae bacterium]|nr:MAG: thiamine-phosphate synthase [Phycisphaerae bacterium]
MNALRLLDANANRAREALRVLEDLARFLLNRADLVERLKSLRHAMTHAVTAAAPDALLRLARRDTPGDVGTTIDAPDEYVRADAHALLHANAARLTEALRALEEAAKLLARPDAARSFEHARYGAYSLEQALLLALGSASRRQWSLCVLLTERLCARPWLDVARAAIDGGADAIQLREKDLADRELLDRARTLVALAHPRSVAVVLNDRPDLARLAQADAVHLGQSDLSVHDARRIVGSMIVGVSTTNLDQARRARLDGADYLGLGPMYPTTTKPKDHIAGPAFVRDVLADPDLAAVPHLAIGGITPSTIAPAVAAGARGVAVSQCVCGSTDPAAVCASLRAALIHAE